MLAFFLKCCPSQTGMSTHASKSPCITLGNEDTQSLVTQYLGKRGGGGRERERERENFILQGL